MDRGGRQTPEELRARTSLKAVFSALLLAVLALAAGALLLVVAVSRACR
jgi:hypothetical protein